jgi:hypothetical protein
MSDPSPLIPLKAALADLVALLGAEQVHALVIGGVAASLLGRPRATRDVDVLVWLAESGWPGFLTAARRHGFEPRIQDPLEFAGRSRVLLLRHAASAIDIDVAIGALPFEELAIERGTSYDLGGLAIPLPRPEDLVVMKAVAHRPRDTADIEGVLAAYPALDRAAVRRTVAEFAEALESPELLSDLERLFARVER